jgi:hypothetical protein
MIVKGEVYETLANIFRLSVAAGNDHRGCCRSAD